MGMFVQLCIGLVFAVYGVFCLIKRENQAREKFIIGLVCFFVGVFLIGYGVNQTV